jgi:hypothetical protein
MVVINLHREADSRPISIEAQPMNGAEPTMSFETFLALFPAPTPEKMAKEFLKFFGPKK